jgi:hypothetical protein
MFEEEFGEEYYNTGNYVDYMQRGDRYVKLSDEVLDLLNKLNLNDGKILDFGCAVGFVMQHLQDLGRDVRGVDISDWARRQCLEKNLLVSEKPDYSIEYGVTFALDVLEHMDPHEVRDFLLKLNSKVIVFRMPICLDGQTDYFLHQSRRDPTHKIRWTKSVWKDLFNSFGYQTLDLNLSTIFCGAGVYSGIAIKL